MTLHPYCQKCGWRKGGVDSWNGKACKCGEYAPPIAPAVDTRPRNVINGVTYVQTGPNTWAPDYSVPGTAEAVKRSVDEAYNAHWSIDKWRK